MAASVVGRAVALGERDAALSSAAGPRAGQETLEHERVFRRRAKDTPTPCAGASARVTGYPAELRELSLCGLRLRTDCRYSTLPATAFTARPL